MSTNTDDITTTALPKKARDMTATIEKAETEDTEKTQGFVPRTYTLPEKKNPGKLGSWRKGLGAGAWLGTLTGMRTKIVLLRLGTLVVDWLLVSVTAMTVLPLMGAYLHEASGAATMPMDARIAFWLLPFVFLSAMIFALEFVVIRGMWRAGTRTIDRWRERSSTVATTVEPSLGKATKTPTTSGPKKNRNRKRRTK